MEKPVGERWKFLFSRGLVIAGITILLAGWWFVRNYVIYDGDILGETPVPCARSCMPKMPISRPFM